MGGKKRNGRRSILNGRVTVEKNNSVQPTVNEHAKGRNPPQPSSSKNKRGRKKKAVWSEAKEGGTRMTNKRKIFEKNETSNPRMGGGNSLRR